MNSSTHANVAIEGRGCLLSEPLAVSVEFHVSAASDPSLCALFLACYWSFWESLIVSCAVADNFLFMVATSLVPKPESSCCHSFLTVPSFELVGHLIYPYAVVYGTGHLRSIEPRCCRSIRTKPRPRIASFRVRRARVCVCVRNDAGPGIDDHPT